MEQEYIFLVNLMTTIIKRFSKLLDSVQYPEEKSSWNIAGIIKGQNAFYKFDVKDMHLISSGMWARKGNTKSKADKMVFELKNYWIIIDTVELFKYLKITKTRLVKLDELLKCLDWNIKLSK